MAQTLPKMVQSAKGESFDVNSPQGKMIVNSPNYKPPFSASSSALNTGSTPPSKSMDPQETLEGIKTSVEESALSLKTMEPNATSDALNKANVLRDDDGPIPTEGDDGVYREDDDSSSSKGGGFLSKLFGGSMAGAGLLVGGFGALLAGGGVLLKEFNNFDGEKFKKNIESIMSIVPSVTSPGAALAFAADTGMFLITMTAIGAGLAAFGIGTGVAGIADKFLGFDAQGVYDNVEILLSINGLFGEGLSALTAAGSFFIAMTAIGAGLAVFGAGAAVGATGDAITQGIDKVTGEKFAQNIVDNVKILLGINDLFGDGLGALAKSGTFFIAMTAIGAGLAVFGAGSAIAATGDAIGQGVDAVTTVGWAQSIVDNVAILLTINDLFTGTFDALAESGTFFIAMTAIGAGLAIFGAGSAVGAATDAIGQGVTKISEKGWAQSIVDNVTTLLSINDLFDGFGDVLAKNGTFLIAMTAITAGLAVFSFGAAVAGATTNALDVTDWATRGEGMTWSQSIVDHVTTLLSIASLPNVAADTGLFAGTMSGISLGLIAFGAGSFFAAGADGLANFISKAEDGEGSWADKIKAKVTTLLSIISNEDGKGATVQKSIDFTTIMGNLSAGLMKFSGGTFVSKLLDVGSKVLGFLSGTKSPITEMLNLASSADELTKGATALDSLSASLEKISKLKFDGKKINMTAFAKDLAASVPVIEAAIMGGTIVKFGPFNDLDFKGLASPEINFADATQNIMALKSALGMEMQVLNTASGATQQLQNVSGQAMTAGAASISFVNAPSTSQNIDASATTIIELKTNHDEPSQSIFSKAIDFIF